MIFLIMGEMITGLLRSKNSSPFRFVHFFHLGLQLRRRLLAFAFAGFLRVKYMTMVYAPPSWPMTTLPIRSGRNAFHLSSVLVHELPGSFWIDLLQPCMICTKPAWSGSP